MFSWRCCHNSCFDFCRKVIWWCTVTTCVVRIYGPYLSCSDITQRKKHIVILHRKSFEPNKVGASTEHCHQSLSSDKKINRHLHSCLVLAILCISFLHLVIIPLLNMQTSASNVVEPRQRTHSFEVNSIRYGPSRRFIGEGLEEKPTPLCVGCKCGHSN